MDKSKTGQYPASQDADFQPMYAMPPRYADDEVSLVDLAKILIRRKVTMFVTAFTVVVLALVYTLIRSEKFEYVSIYQVAEQEVGEPMNAIAGLTALIDRSFLPAVKRTYDEENLPKIATANPKGTPLIVLETVTISKNEELITKMHQQIFDKLLAYEQQRVEGLREKLNQELRALNELIDTATVQANVSSELISGYSQRKNELASELSQIQLPQVQSIASNNGKVSKFSNSLVLALGFILGCIGGVMAAFIKEFASRVRESLEAERL